MSDTEDEMMNDFSDFELDDNDNDNDNENMWEQPTVEMRAGITAYQQVGFGDINVSDIPQNRFEKALLDPLSRFRLYVNAIARNLNDKETIITESSIRYIIEQAQFIDNIKYKNPAAYVLGYIILQDNMTDINMNMFKYTVENIIDNASIHFVTQPDIIRYARFWMDLKNKTSI